MDNLYLDNLEEFVFDEGRVVTYRWLSLTLSVNVNLAKQMLYHFVEKEREKKKDCLSVTYLVTGVAKERNGILPAHKVLVVEEDRLEKVKASLKEVQCVHVYSVQKYKIKDLGVLYTSDYDKLKECRDESKYSGIVNADVKLRSNSDVAALQKEHAYKPPEQPEPPKSKFAVKKESASPKKSPKKFEIRGNKATQSLQSMFANQAKKAELKKENANEEKPQISAQVTKGPAIKNKPKGGLASFLARGPTKPTATKEVKCIDIKQEAAEDVEEVKEDIKEVPVVVKEEIKETVSPIKKSISKPVEQKPKSRGKAKRRADDEDPLPNVKRKRIMQMSDSESSSEDEENIEDEESPLPPTPPPPVSRIESESEDEIPPTPELPKKTDGGKKRIRKCVQKTFFNEDGFIETKTEFVMVSEDEDEVTEVGSLERSSSEEEKKENSDPKNTLNKMPELPKNNVNRKMSPSKTKQTTIFNFFKKT
ncbi:uncharacterized protein LOC143026225 isoform X2 [Oratosquilla oratoria]|uniref:uncharacterized protein LOC143026225 isoform X2 n=1 Tax=Oratosquilla oratoria TaxID=337810 RepID=UPI003F757D46